ncbi:hypothetical protein XENOCAPTIV_014840, partial [Xenoophorus captivus]
HLTDGGQLEQIFFIIPTTWFFFIPACRTSGLGQNFLSELSWRRKQHLHKVKSAAQFKQLSDYQPLVCQINNVFTSHHPGPRNWINCCRSVRHPDLSGSEHLLFWLRLSSFVGTDVLQMFCLC